MYTTMSSIKIHPSNVELSNQIDKLGMVFQPPDDDIYLDSVPFIDYSSFFGELIINYYLFNYLKKFDLTKNNNAIVLKDRQILNVNRAYHIIVNYGKVIDISHMGAGKSYMMAVLSIMLDLPIVIVSSKNIESSWEILYEKEFSMMGDMKFYSLDKISGSLTNPPNGKGEYLVKAKKEGKGKSAYLVYSPGEKLNKLIRKGCLFVFDEIHRCKNVNNFTEVVHCISRAVDDLSVSEGTRSKCIYASGTLSDKKDISPLLYAMSICDNPEMCSDGEENSKSLKRYVNLCKNTDKYTVETIRRKCMSREEDNKIYVKKLFCQIIMPRLCTYVSMKESSIPMMMNPDFKPNVKYVLYKLNTKNGFDRIIRDAAKKIITNKKKSMEIYNQLNKVFNYCSIIPTIGDAIYRLMKHDNSKVIIYSNVVTYDTNKSVIKFIANHIKKKLAEQDIDISVATMESSDKDRAYIINKFMNNDKCRVFVTSPDVGGTGVDLDDKLGNKKIYNYVNMNHKGDVLEQSIFRVFRASTRSAPKIKIPICIGNDLHLPDGSDKPCLFKNLKAYEKAMNIKETSLEKAGKKPNGNLNYLVIKRVNEKLENLSSFNTNTIIGDPTQISYKFYPVAKYPSRQLYNMKDGTLPKEFEKVLENII